MAVLQPSMKSSLFYLNSLPKIPFPVFPPILFCWNYLFFTFYANFRECPAVIYMLFTGALDHKRSLHESTCFQSTFYWQSLQSSISADTFFSRLCQLLEQSLQLDCIVWEWGGSVCEAMHGWSHALATPQECSRQTNMFLFHPKTEFQ